MRKFLLIFLMLATPLMAVQPDEILDDPVLETRARDISKELRCLVCRNENIDDSNAGLARDLRLLVRERLVAGDSDSDVLQYIVDRYGEYVLLKPTFSRANLLLWLSGPLLLFIGAILAIKFIRQRPDEKPVDALSASEQERLDALLDK